MAGELVGDGPQAVGGLLPAAAAASRRPRSVRRSWPQDGRSAPMAPIGRSRRRSRLTPSCGGDGRPAGSRPSGSSASCTWPSGCPWPCSGVAWPTLRDELGRADGDLGVLVLAYGLGRLVTSASSGPLLRPTALRARVGDDAGRPRPERRVGGYLAVVERPWSWPSPWSGSCPGCSTPWGPASWPSPAACGAPVWPQGATASGRRSGRSSSPLTDSVAVGFLTGAVVALVAAAMVVAPGHRLAAGARLAAGGHPADVRVSRWVWPSCCARRRCWCPWACSPPS